MSEEDREACEIVATALGIAKEQVRSDDGIHTIPEWDSLGHLEVVQEVEGRTGVSIADNRTFEQLVSVSGITRYLTEFRHGQR